MAQRRGSPRKGAGSDIRRHRDRGRPKHIFLFHGKVGGWLLVLFLVPVTLAMHNFWAVKDPMMQQIQMVMFLKNLSMLGASLFFAQVGTGPLSLDATRQASLPHAVSGD